MDIDGAAHAGGKGSLTLPQVLGHVIAYPTSIPSLRRAIRQHFSQVEDVIVLIEVVNTRVFDSAKKTLTIKLGDVDEEPKPGEQTNHERAVEKDGLPRLDLVCSFFRRTGRATEFLLACLFCLLSAGRSSSGFAAVP